MKEILLTNGYICLVSDEGFDYLNQFKWHKTPLGYAARANKTGTPKSILMHREILQAQIGDWSDHIDRDRLNNQRSNLRICSKKENNQNRSPVSKTSKYKGVSWQKDRKKWCAGIKIDGISKNLGRFEREEDAALAYNFAAEKNFGKYAYLNSVSP